MHGNIANKIQDASLLQLRSLFQCRFLSQIAQSVIEYGILVVVASIVSFVGMRPNTQVDSVAPQRREAFAVALELNLLLKHSRCVLKSETPAEYRDYQTNVQRHNLPLPSLH